MRQKGRIFVFFGINSTKVSVLWSKHILLRSVSLHRNLSYVTRGVCERVGATYNSVTFARKLMMSWKMVDFYLTVEFTVSSALFAWFLWNVNWRHSVRYNTDNMEPFVKKEWKILDMFGYLFYWLIGLRPFKKCSQFEIIPKCWPRRGGKRKK